MNEDIMGEFGKKTYCQRLIGRIEVTKIQCIFVYTHRLDFCTINDCYKRLLSFHSSHASIVGFWHSM